jgi:hypothetical protein
MNGTDVVVGKASLQASRTHRLRGLIGTGVVAVLGAVAATTLAAAVLEATGISFEIPEGGGESIPLAGFAFVTGVFSVVGVVVAVALLRWSTSPAKRFVWTTLSLTALSLVPPFISGADTATIAALVGLHLVAASVMIPTLARALRVRTA